MAFRANVALASGQRLRGFRDGATADQNTPLGTVMTDGITSKSLALGGQLGHVYGNNPTAILGEYQALVVYPAALSDAEIDSITAALRTIYETQAPAPTQALFFVGDSITEGVGAAHNRTLARQLSDALATSTLARANGIAGVTAASLSTSIFLAGHGARWRHPGAVNVAHILAGTNDITGGATASTIYGYLQTLVTNAKSATGFQRTALATILPRADATWTSAYETVRNDLNALIRANSAGADVVVDYAADPMIGAASAPNDPALFSTDKLHPAEGGYGVMAGVAKAALAGIGFA